MKKKYCLAGYPCIILLSTATFSLTNLFFPAGSYGQSMGPIKSEIATCQINVITKEVVSSASKAKGLFKQKIKTADVVKSYKPGINQLGYFHKVSNVQPLQKIPVQLNYPKCSAGDKVVIAVADGGTLENGSKVQVVQLDNEKKLQFNFIAGKDPGIYRIFLRKGSDTKVVQLWVGEETLSLRK